MSLGVSEASFKRHRKALLDHTMVENVGTEKSPRYLAKRDTDA